MTDYLLPVLIERLLWPIARVRLEAARGLASLIRAGSTEAREALLAWIERRKLESEVVIGLSVIDAFDLGKYFDFVRARDASHAASHLSDWLLKRSFESSQGLFPFRYDVAPATIPPLPDDQADWFDSGIGSAVPMIFQSCLKSLEDDFGRPFLSRWRHEWTWLQKRDPRPFAQFPRYFDGGIRGGHGHFDLGQREHYVSAYLRTLAFATFEWGMPHWFAEDCARLAMVMNRGLAECVGIQRPDWSRQILNNEIASARDVANLVWLEAQRQIGPDEDIVALKAVDHTENQFIELDYCRAAGPVGLRNGIDAPTQYRSLTAVATDGEFGGPIASRAGSQIELFNSPKQLVQGVFPADIARLHIDIGLNVRLASPFAFSTPGEVEVTDNDIRLRTQDGILSRWTYWYADWTPIVSSERDGPLSHLTTVNSQRLKNLMIRDGTEFGIWVQIKRGHRRESYLEFEVDKEQFWLKP